MLNVCEPSDSIYHIHLLVWLPQIFRTLSFKPLSKEGEVTRHQVVKDHASLTKMKKTSRAGPDSQKE